MTRPPYLAAAKQAAAYLLLASLLLLAIGAVHYQAERRVERTERHDSENANVAAAKVAIVETLENVASDLAYLAAHNHARGLFRADSHEVRTALTEDFLAFVTEKQRYDHVRYLDPAGMELVRVNYNGGTPDVVPAAKLQNKSDRYYVEASKDLEIGEIYISPFDLNVEHGRVEQPAKPVIRFATPVLDAAGVRSGTLLLNYLGEDLLQRFRTAAASASDRVMLLDAQGYWMSSPRPEEEWGLMRGQTHTFGSRFKAAWQRLRHGSDGLIETDAGLFTYAAIDPARTSGGDLAAPEAGRDLWYVVAHVPLEELQVTPARFAARHVPLYLTMLALLTAASLLLGRATVRHRVAERQLACELRFRSVLEEVELEVVGIDPSGTVTFCNDALLSLVGRERADVIGRDWIEALVAPEARHECHAMMSRLLASEEAPSRHETWLSTRDEERRLVVWHGVPALDDEGCALGVTLLGEDITEARRTEETLRRLSSAVEQSPSTVMITDLAGAIEYVNPKFTELTGYQLSEVRGMNPSMLKTGKTTPEEYADLWRTIASGGVWRGIFRNRKKDGDMYWESATISALRGRDDEVVSFLAVKEDITEQRLLEDRFRHCVESAPNGLVLVDHEGRIVLVNRETERMFGHDREALLGESVEMLVPDSARPDHTGLREAFLSAPRSRAMGIGKELSGQHSDGHLFPVEIGLHAIDSDEGPMALAAIVDITQRRQLEKELSESNREIAKTGALAAVGQMANMVAHDLRNPLSSIKMGLQIIGKHGAGRWGDEEAELHGIALKQVRYMEEVLDDLLSYSRENHMALEWLQVNQLLDAAILLVQKHIDDGGVKVTVRYQTGLPTLHGDAAQLRRAFCNLILNGIQATEGIEGRLPELTISTHLELAPDRPKIRISIRDNGRGLDAEDAARAFEPFYTTRAMGTGLGLAIVRRIIEKHDGTVELSANDGYGSRAWMVLPTGPIEPGARRSESAPSGSAEPDARGSVDLEAS